MVLDEFDALLEYKPHRDPTAAIVGALKQRHRDALQSILCSATATDMVGSNKLDRYLRPGFAQAMADRDDVFVTSADTGDDDAEATKGLTRVSRTVIHGVIHVDHRRFALDTLRRILHTEPIPQQILIFAENSRKVGIVVEKVRRILGSLLYLASSRRILSLVLFYFCHCSSKTWALLLLHCVEAPRVRR